jgi:hypothetical protein
LKVNNFERIEERPSSLPILNLKDSILTIEIYSCLEEAEDRPPGTIGSPNSTEGSGVMKVVKRRRLGMRYRKRGLVE